MVSGIASVLIISKFSVMFDGLSSINPKVTAVILDSSGWIPGGFFFFASVLLIVLSALKKDKIAGIASIVTILLMICTLVTVPLLLYTALSVPIQQLEAYDASEKQNKPEVAAPRRSSD